MIKVELIYTFATRKQKVEVIEVDDDGLLSEANFRALLSIKIKIRRVRRKP